MVVVNVKDFFVYLFPLIIMFRMKVEFDIPDAVLIIVLNMDEHE